VDSRAPVACLPVDASDALRRLGYQETSDLDALAARVVGSYVLAIRVDVPTSIVVGQLGAVRLRRGAYAYSGSAMRGLRARLSRHARAEKRRHWHVDYLLDVGRIDGVWIHIGPERLECTAARALASSAGATYPVAGFGSSDCRCRSHLVAWERLGSTKS
jgi:Uri superfamily endonuclease